MTGEGGAVGGPRGGSEDGPQGDTRGEASLQFLAIGECMIEMSGGSGGIGGIGDTGETPGAGGTWRLGFAGDTLNTLWYARAGLDPANGAVGYFTALGTDAFSDRIAAFMVANGIATERIARLPLFRPGLYMIEQRDGDRHFTYWRENSAARRLADDETALAAVIAAARLVYFSGITLAILKPDRRTALIRLLGEARTKGTIVAFDPNIRPALWEDAAAMRAAITEAAGCATIVLPSFDDEARNFGDADPATTARRYRVAGAGTVVVKNGGAPVLIDAGPGENAAVEGAAVEGKPVIEIEAARDVEVVDATGAGDSFNGAYLAALLSGADAIAAGRAGCAMAAQVVGAHGALIETEAMTLWRSDRRGPQL